MSSHALQQPWQRRKGAHPPQQPETRGCPPQGDERRGAGDHLAAAEPDMETGQRRLATDAIGQASLLHGDVLKGRAIGSAIAQALIQRDLARAYRAASVIVDGTGGGGVDRSALMSHRLNVEEHRTGTTAPNRLIRPWAGQRPS